MIILIVLIVWNAVSKCYCFNSNILVWNYQLN